MKYLRARATGSAFLGHDLVIETVEIHQRF
jgi:hypothetical protein